MPTDLTCLRLNARIDEGSGPVIVMLHGINSDAGDWRPVIDAIGPGYRFIGLDLLGFGDSPKPLDIAYDADEHALVIENTLCDLGVTEPFLLVGYSLGGDIALRYASTYPQRLRRLFLLDAPFYLPSSELEGSGLGLQYLWDVGSQKVWDVLAGAKHKQDFLYRIATGVGEKALEDAFHSEDISTHWDIMSKNLTNTVNAATWVDDLPKLTMPVVHAIGVHDAIVKVSQAPALRRLKPDMEIRRIGGFAADHMTLWNMPQRVAEEIMRDEINGLSVAWRGGSGDAIVLLHGLGGDSAAWEPAARVLSRRHDVAVVDLLGFGRSPAPLSLRYDLPDHVAAVLGTVSSLWGTQRRVTFVGEGLGATVALGCAVAAPERSAGVVAFSPGLLEPGTSLDDAARDERAARAVVAREQTQRLADLVRQRGGTAAEARLVPLLRSAENAMLSVDSAELISRVPAPVRFVIPSSDALTPAAFLTDVSSARVGLEAVVVEGERGLPYTQPSQAVRAIDPDDQEGIMLAASMDGRVPAGSGPVVERVAGDIESALLRTGVLNLAAAVLVVALHPVPSELLTLGFGLWVALSSLSAVVAALTMKRKSTSERFSFVTTALPTLLLGLVGLALASAVFADPETGRRFFGLCVAAYAMLRGAADLWMARRVGDPVKPRWMLIAGGVLGIVIALSILFGPNHGRGVVRLSLAAYLTLTGVSLVGYVVASRREAGRRVREVLRRVERGMGR